LEHVAGFLRTELAENLGLKRTPELRFRRDPASRSFMRDDGEEKEIW
jgi:ribosome-binding factor A